MPVGSSHINTLSIQSEDRLVIKRVLGRELKPFAAAAAKLYRWQGRRWEVFGSPGALVLYHTATDRRIFRLSLVDLDGMRVVWEYELYNGMQIVRPLPHFLTFEGDEGCWVGILFVHEGEAAGFELELIEKTDGLVTSQFWPREPQPKAKGFFNSFFGSARKTTEKTLRPEDIGDPTDFQHLAHIGFDPMTGAFDLKNIPPEWQQMFHKAGVTEEQLKDRETANFIVSFVQEQQQSSALVNNKPDHPKSSPRGPPPPPPAKTIRGPPPPPPSRTKRVVVEATPSEPLLRNSSVEAQPRGPVSDPKRNLLMASIREVGGGTAALRKVEPPSSPSAAPATPADPTDLMASMLAKALAQRNRRLAQSGRMRKTLIIDLLDSEGSDEEDW